MKRRNLRTLFASISILAAILACNIPSSATQVPATDLSPTELPSTEVVSVVETATSSPPTEIPIQHQIIPVSLPASRSGHAGDYDSSVTAKDKKSNGGDRFTFEKFERPFNANTMDVYFPELDIVDTFVFQDDIWVYGTIQVVDRSAATSSPYRFAMQLDTQADGKGDFLVIASNPSTTDWTTDGVQVFQDANSDVGDLTAMLTDANAKGDGFEKMVFDQGKGDDPDVAWIRVSPKDPNIVEIAIKRSVMGNTFIYMIDMWAGHATLDPAMFDYSDHFTHEQAGAADPELPLFYPIKSVFEIDNSCRMAVGFQPTGAEPGLCPVLAPLAPGDPPTPGCQLNDAICAAMGPGYYFDAPSCSCFYLGYQKPLCSRFN